MHTILIIMKVLLTILAVTLILQAIYKERRNMKFATTIWSRFSWLMLFEVLAIIFQTVIIYSLLVWISPVFKYGWMHLFLDNGGNMFVAPITEIASSGMGLTRVFPFLFLTLFLVAIPFLARNEENIFRKSAYEWPEIATKSVVFGLIHCLVGVPLAAGIALIGTGFFYGYKYRRAFLINLKTYGNNVIAEKEALLVSTTYHTLYNSILIVVLMILIGVITLN